MAVARRRYVALSFDEGSGQITIGIRKLGHAKLKGLGSLAIFELVDGDAWTTQELESLRGTTLLAEVEKDYELVTRSSAYRL